jgi:hypothetical protein
MDAGFVPKVSPREYQASCPPGVAIADGDGRLRPFAEIAIKYDEDNKPTLNNDGLQSLDKWLIVNGMGKEKKLLGGLSEDFASNFDGNKSQANSRASGYA